MKNLVKISLAALMFMAVSPSFAGGIDVTNTSNSNSQAGSVSGVNIVNPRNYKGTGNAIAPGLIASGLSCAGSTSAAVGWMGGAFSLGFTNMDKDCNRRENAKVVGLTGDVPAAKQVMCNIKEVADAYAAVGRPCIGDNRRYAPVGRVGKAKTYTVASTSNISKSKSMLNYANKPKQTPYP